MAKENVGRIEIDDDLSLHATDDKGRGWSSPNGGGGSQPGVHVTKAIPFTFADSVALAAGIPIYTPAVGDLLIDFAFILATAFNGTTPSADVSQFTGSAAPYGLLGDVVGPFNLAGAEDSINTGGGPASAAGAAGPNFQTTLALTKIVLAFSNAGSDFAAWGPSALATIQGRIAPARFTSVDPLLLVASQDGTRGGTPIDSDEGAAVLYITTCTPAT